MTSRGQMRSHNSSKGPSFVLVGLLIVTLMLFYKYWSSSSTIADLSAELTLCRSRTSKFPSPAVKETACVCKEKPNNCDQMKLELDKAKSDLVLCSNDKKTDSGPANQQSDEEDGPSDELRKFQDQLLQCKEALEHCHGDEQPDGRNNEHKMTQKECDAQVKLAVEKASPKKDSDKLKIRSEVAGGKLSDSSNEVTKLESRDQQRELERNGENLDKYRHLVSLDRLEANKPPGVMKISQLKDPNVQESKEPIVKEEKHMESDRVESQKGEGMKEVDSEKKDLKDKTQIGEERAGEERKTNDVEGEFIDGGDVDGKDDDGVGEGEGVDETSKAEEKAEISPKEDPLGGKKKNLADDKIVANVGEISDREQKNSRLVGSSGELHGKQGAGRREDEIDKEPEAIEKYRAALKLSEVPGDRKANAMTLKVNPLSNETAGKSGDGDVFGKVSSQDTSTVDKSNTSLVGNFIKNMAAKLLPGWKASPKLVEAFKANANETIGGKNESSGREGKGAVIEKMGKSEEKERKEEFGGAPLPGKSVTGEETKVEKGVDGVEKSSVQDVQQGQTQVQKPGLKEGRGLSVDNEGKVSATTAINGAGVKSVLSNEGVKQPLVGEDAKLAVSNESVKPPASNEGFKPVVGGEGVKPVESGKDVDPPAKEEGVKSVVRGERLKDTSADTIGNVARQRKKKKVPTATLR